MIKQNALLYDDIQKNGVSPELLEEAFKQHLQNIPRYEILGKYYNGNHKIHERVQGDKNRPNTKMANAFPKYIVTMTTGYLLGDKVKYSSDRGVNTEPLTEVYDKSGFWSSDEEIARDMGVYGKALELLYLNKANPPFVQSKVINPANSFVVYSDDVSDKPMYGIYYYSRLQDGIQTKQIIMVYTTKHLYTYETTNKTIDSSAFVEPVVTQHFFEDIPIIEYYNNEEYRGDFEPVIDLIDAYDLLQSDRVNDVERFVQAILFLKNFTLAQADAKLLKENRILSAIGQDTDAKWLVNALDQQGIEVLRKTIEADIHKFSFVPSMSDENFANNVSGVAMRFKLIGLAQMTKIKKRYMEKGLRQRLRLIINVPNKRLDIKEADLTVEFTHSLPVNELEIAQMIQTLTGLVTNETLIELLPFVTDSKAENQAVEAEQARKLVETQRAFDAPLSDE